MNRKLKIIYEDKYLIAVVKPHNLLTISTDKEKEKTLYRMVSEYVKKQHKSNKIFVIHRLDKDTSGIVLFGKDKKSAKMIQDDWDNVLRKYVALVEGKIDKKGIIENYLVEGKDLKTFITDDKRKGKLAITMYQPIKQVGKNTLVDIVIKTGRKNQIRVHMSSIGHPIIGDNKYGTDKKDKRMYLHEYKLSFAHPITKNILELETDINI